MRVYLFIICFFFSITAFSQKGNTQRDEEKDTLKTVIRQWVWAEDHQTKISIPIDTFMTEFHIYNPVYKQSIGGVDLGNLGTPSTSNVFSDRNNSSDFIFNRAFMPYFIRGKNLPFFNTNKAFTNLEYSMSGKPIDEGRIKALHTQNINPYFNFGILYNSMASTGAYLNQEAKNTNFGLWFSYNKNHYSMYACWVNNEAKSQENGGIIENQESEGLVPVNLNTPKTLVYNRDIIISQSAYLGRKDEDTIKTKEFEPYISLTHTFSYERNHRIYSDNKKYSDFYENYYVDSTSTRDSIYQRSITNTLQLKVHDRIFTWLRAGGRAEIGHEKLDYYNFRDYIRPINTKDDKNIFASVSLFSQSGSFLRWNATIKHFIDGRRKNDFELSANIIKPLHLFGDSSSLEISVYEKNKTPSYFEEHFFANNIRWDKNFDKTRTRNIKGIYSYPKYGIKAGANIQEIDEMIYFGKDAIPEQSNNLIYIYSGFLDFSLDIWKLKFINKIVWQKSSDENVVHIPQLSIYTSLNYNFKLFDVLHFQTGVCANYRSKHYSYKYMPASGIFYNQKEIESSEYAILDAYINFKLKRTVFFLKGRHLNSLWTGKRYFPVVNQPLHDFTIKFGIQWKFYN